MSATPTLSQLPYAALQAALNQALEWAPATACALQTLAGQRIGLAFSRPAFSFCLHLGYPVYISALDNSHPDCTLSGPLSAFIQLAQQPSPSLANTGVTLSGNSALLGQAFQLFKQLKIDWEAPLTALFGPVPGHLLAQTLAAGLAPLPGYAEKTAFFFGDYLMHERQITPSAPELNAFYQDINRLHALGERLAARFEHLNTKAPQ